MSSLTETSSSGNHVRSNEFSLKQRTTILFQGTTKLSKHFQQVTPYDLESTIQIFPQSDNFLVEINIIIIIIIIRVVERIKWINRKALENDSRT